LVGRQEVTLEPGQFIFGRKAASDELDIHESAIYRIVKFLDKAGNIHTKANNKFSIISINNWHTYQQDETEIEQPANNKRTTSEHKQTHKNKKNNTYTPDFETFWKAYPNRVGKGAALQAWNKNGRPPIETILKAIISQILWRKSAKPNEFRPEWKNPSTWLNQKCWEDEVKVEQSNGKPIITG